MTNHPNLVGWLYVRTRNVAIDTICSEQRSEKLAHLLTTMPEDLISAECASEWDQLRPANDAAMDELKEQDREIMPLRFQGQMFGEIGAKPRRKTTPACTPHARWRNFAYSSVRPAVAAPPRVDGGTHRYFQATPGETTHEGGFVG